MTTKDRPANPKVSVVIPRFNAKYTIKICLGSIFSQSYQPCEVIVVDDRSTDDSPSIARQMGAKIFTQEKNQGPALARNRGAKEAGGDVLFFVDSDTAMQPGTIANMVSTITRPGIDAVVGRYAKNSINTGLVPEYYALLKHHSKTFEGIEDHSVFCGECVGSWREAFLDTGGYNPLPWGMDFENEEMGRRFIKKYHIVIDPSVEVRHHFPPLKKLIRLFYNRTYWWVRFYFVHRTFEKALTTKSFAVGSVSGFLILPLATLTGLLEIYTGISKPFYISSALLTIVILLFANSYRTFIQFVRQEKGVLFSIAATALSALLSWPITIGAIHGVLDYTIKGKPNIQRP